MPQIELVRTRYEAMRSENLTLLLTAIGVLLALGLSPAIVLAATVGALGALALRQCDSVESVI
jgi:hypothetical protein